MDRVTLVEAYYVWLTDHHTGQWSPEYRRLCRIRRYYRPWPDVSYQTLSPDGREVYRELCHRAGCSHGEEEEEE